MHALNVKYIYNIKKLLREILIIALEELLRVIGQKFMKQKSNIKYDDYAIPNWKGYIR